MDNVEEQDKKTRALRKRKATFVFDENYESDASDVYVPPKDAGSDDSDDSFCEVKKTKKFKKSKTSHDDAELKAKGKKSCESLNGLENNSSVGSGLKGKKKDAKNGKGKASHKGGKQGVRGKVSKPRGRPPGRKTTQAGEQRKKRGKKKVKETKIQQLKKNSSMRAPRLGPFSVIGHWYIASGVIQDLTDLFEAFNKQDSWRFRDFAACWQKLQFSLIYRGRYSFKELLQFTEELLFWTKKFLSPPHSRKWRVGALYALYGLHNKHPFRYRIKIRMVVEEYENLVSLASSFQSSTENPDPAYIFYKMKADDVFYHVALPEEMGWNFYSSERQRDSMSYAMQWILPEQSTNTIFTEHQHSIQKTLMQEYDAIKSKIWGKEKGSDKAMSYVQSSILSEVDAMLAELQQDGRQPSRSKPSTDVNHDHDASTEISEIGQRKKEILKKAAALSTTEEFFKRKQLRSPLKKFRKSINRHADETLGGSYGSDGDTSNNEDDPETDDGSRKVTKFREIMDFMQPPQEGDLDIASRSCRVKDKTSQKYSIDEESNQESDGVCEALDSQNIVLPNEYLQPRSEELEPMKRDKSKARVVTLQGNSGASPLKAVQCQQNHPEDETTSSPKQKRKRGRPRKSNPKNKIRCKPLEESQVIEKNRTLESNPTSVGKFEEIFLPCEAPRSNHRFKNKVRCNPLEESQVIKENRTLESNPTSEPLFEEIYLPCVASRSDKHNDLLPDDTAKKLNGNSLQKETHSPESEQSRPKTTHRQMDSLYDGKENVEGFKKNKKAPSHGSDEALCSDEVDQEDNHQEDQEENHQVDQEEACKDFTEEVCNLDPSTTENVVMTILVSQGMWNDKIIIPCCESDQNNASDPRGNDMLTKVKPLSQENLKDLNHIRKVLDVELVAGKRHKTKLHAILEAESMVFVEVNFHEDNFVVHSAKLKMSIKDVKALQINKAKLKGLKKKLYSFLPPRYKDYELNIQLTVHQSPNGTPEEQSEVSEALAEQQSNQSCGSPGRYDKQGSEPSPEKPLRQGCESLPKDESLPKEHTNQGHESTPVTPQGHESTSVTPQGHESTPVTPQGHESTPVTPQGHESTPVMPQGHESTPVTPQGHESTPVTPLTCTATPKTDDNIPHEEPTTSHTQEGKDYSRVMEDNHNGSTSLHGTCDDINLAGEVLEVEMVAIKSKKNNTQKGPKADTVHLRVRFRAGGVQIHQTKFAISKKDLRTLQNDKKKLESFKAKFYSILPAKYQKYKMRLQLTAPQAVVNDNETPRQHSRRGSDSSILPQAPATPVKAEDTPQVEPSTSHCQESLHLKDLNAVRKARTFTTNRVQNSPSKSPPPRIQQNVPNTGRVKGYYLPNAAEQGQDSISNTAKPVYTNLLPLQQGQDSISNAAKPVYTNLLPLQQGQDSISNTAKPVYTNLLPLQQGQGSISNAAQPVYTNLLPLQSTHESGVSLVTGGSHHPEAIGFDSVIAIPLSTDIENTPHKVFQKQKQKHLVIHINEDTLTSPIVVESEAGNMSECKPEVIHVAGRITATQRSGTAKKECPLKAPDEERTLLAVHADNSLGEPCHDFINKDLSTSSPVKKEKDIYASPDGCIQPHYIKEEASNSTALVTHSTQELYTENCTIPWQGRRNPTSTSDNHRLTALPLNRHHKTVRKEQGKALSKTERLTGDLPSNADLENPQASTSTVSESPRCNNTTVTDGVSSSRSYSTSTSVSGNLQDSATTSTSESKVNQSPVCSFNFFSKRNKCDVSQRKQVSSVSSVKKPCVPFLFMEKKFPKKNP